MLLDYLIYEILVIVNLIKGLYNFFSSLSYLAMGPGGVTTSMSQTPTTIVYTLDYLYTHRYYSSRMKLKI